MDNNCRDSEEKHGMVQDFILEERARALVGKCKYYEASSLLDNLRDVDSADLDLKLLMAECYLQLGRENKAEKIEGSIRKYFIGSGLDVMDEIIAIVDVLTAGQAILLLRIACDIVFASAKSPDEVIEGVYRCIDKMRTSIRKLLDSQGLSSLSIEGLIGQLQGQFSNLLRPLKALNSIDLLSESNQKPMNPDSTRLQVIGLDFGVDYMIEMLNKLLGIEVENTEKKAIKLAWICSHIGYNLAIINDNTRSINFRKRGVSILESEFREHANKHNVYGVLLHNIGIVLANSGRRDEAEYFYIEAIKAKETAIDYGDTNEQQKDIKLSRDALTRVRSGPI
ncbi:uncharacterized protein LOC120329186 [Styela clava]